MGLNGEAADEYVHRIARDWRTAGLAPVDDALCQYAEKLTRAPGKVTAEDLQPLRAHGLSDRAIHDAVQVIGYFNYINRIADGLGVDEEDFVRSWEESARPVSGKE